MTAVTAPERTRSLTLVASGGLGTDIAPFLRLATLPGMFALARVFGRPDRAVASCAAASIDASRIPETLY